MKPRFEMHCLHVFKGNFIKWIRRFTICKDGLIPEISESVKSILREKCPYSEFFWSVFSCILTEYWVSLRIQSECGKIPTRKIRNTDTFRAVQSFSTKISQSICPTCHLYRNQLINLQMKTSWIVLTSLEQFLYLYLNITKSINREI